MSVCVCVGGGRYERQNSGEAKMLGIWTIGTGRNRGKELQLDISTLRNCTETCACRLERTQCLKTYAYFTRMATNLH